VQQGKNTIFGQEDPNNSEFDALFFEHFFNILNHAVICCPLALKIRIKDNKS